MDRLINVFADTQDFYTNDPVLKEAVALGMEHTKLYQTDDYPDLPDIPEKPDLTLTLNLKSFQAAMKYHEEFLNRKIVYAGFQHYTH